MDKMLDSQGSIDKVLLLRSLQSGHEGRQANNPSAPQHILNRGI